MIRFSIFTLLIIFTLISEYQSVKYLDLEDQKRDMGCLGQLSPIFSPSTLYAFKICKSCEARYLLDFIFYVNCDATITWMCN